MKSVCVFCGANFNGDPAIKQVVGQLAEVMVSKDVMVEQRFLKPANRKLVLTSADALELVNLMENINIKPDEVWFRDRDLT